MIRVTFDMLPGGDPKKARTIGIMEIANICTRLDGTADYAVALKKTPPFTGALQQAWRKGIVTHDDKAVTDIMTTDDEEMIAAVATGHHRTRRGVYDLLFKALLACGLASRN